MITAFLSKVLFWMFVGMGAMSWFLIVRFLTNARKTGALGNEELEALSRLLISGSGGAKSEWRSLTFILDRGYAGFNDMQTTKAGDRARISWLITFGLMICTGLSLMLFGW